MSVEKRYDCIYDIDTIEKAAGEMGYITVRNSKVRGYGSSGSHADLVIRGKNNGHDVGFIQNNDGTTTIVGDRDDNSMTNTLIEVLPRYLEKKLSKCGSKYRIRKVSKQGTQLKVHVA